MKRTAICPFHWNPSLFLNFGLRILRITVAGNSVEIINAVWYIAACKQHFYEWLRWKNREPNQVVNELDGKGLN